MAQPNPLWVPKADQIESSTVVAFMDYVNHHHGCSLRNFDELYQWSVDCREQFWLSVWRFMGVLGSPGDAVLVHGERIEDSDW